MRVFDFVLFPASAGGGGGDEPPGKSLLGGPFLRFGKFQLHGFYDVYVCSLAAALAAGTIHVCMGRMDDTGRARKGKERKGKEKRSICMYKE